MIRPRRSEDLQPCLAVLRAVHLADRYPVRWPQDPARWLVGHAGLAAWVSETDGAPDGHLSLHGTDERLAVVSRFFVAPDARARGVGSALMGTAGVR
jgi:GNAT superfamily N-acetyltransferase